MIFDEIFSKFQTLDKFNSLKIFPLNSFGWYIKFSLLLNFQLRSELDERLFQH